MSDMREVTNIEEYRKERDVSARIPMSAGQRGLFGFTAGFMEAISAVTGPESLPNALVVGGLGCVALFGAVRGYWNDTPRQRAISEVAGIVGLQDPFDDFDNRDKE